jgi:hypothetical protein
MAQAGQVGAFSAMQRLSVKRLFVSVTEDSGSHEPGARQE